MFIDTTIFNGLSLHIDVQEGIYELRDGEGDVVAFSTVADGIMDAARLDALMRSAAYLEEPHD